MPRTAATRQELLNEARDLLIGFLCDPPQGTDVELKRAISRLARDMDYSYERALRLILTGYL